MLLREKAKTRAELRRERNNIETQTGTNVLNMNTFKNLKFYIRLRIKAS
jgi:hypothetical protein